MSGHKGDSQRAMEVLEAINEARARVDALGLDEQAFLKDDTIQMRIAADSLLMCTLRITEEAGNLSDQSKEAFPSIDWRGISGMRTFLAHDYGRIDRKIVWNAIAHEFDDLEKVCKQILEDAGIHRR